MNSMTAGPLLSSASPAKQRSLDVMTPNEYNIFTFFDCINPTFQRGISQEARDIQAKKGKGESEGRRAQFPDGENGGAWRNDNAMSVFRNAFVIE
jgi:hypothetical protein